jgi:hypothetical protein
MVKGKDVAVGLAAAGGAAALGFYLMKRAAAAEKYRLTVNALADSTPIAVDVTVDSQRLTTPGYLDLDPGTYTVTAPDQTWDAAGNVYIYAGYE